MPALPGGPADRAGLRQGDIVVTYRGQQVLDMDQMVRLVGATRVGQKTEVVLHRKAAVMTMNVEVARRRPTADAGPKSDPDEWRGLAVREITAGDRTRLKLPAGASGAVVDHIRPGSPAALASVEGGLVRLAAGDLIVKNRRVGNRRPLRLPQRGPYGQGRLGGRGVRQAGHPAGGRVERIDR